MAEMAHLRHPGDDGFGHRRTDGGARASDKTSNSARFAAVYEQSTVACNTSYRGADRDFRPVKE
jgi:hypothetical protein